jgi:hypothetical protein
LKEKRKEIDRGRIFVMGFCSDCARTFGSNGSLGERKL